MPAFSVRSAAVIMYQTYRRYYAKTFNIMTVTKITDNVMAKIIKLPIFIQIYIIFLKNFFQTRPFLKIGPGGGKTRGLHEKSGSRTGTIAKNKTRFLIFLERKAHTKNKTYKVPGPPPPGV